jgi:hypothetical protein
LADKPLTLSEKDLRAMTVATITADQPKVGSASFTGVRISDLMKAASVQAAAATLVLTGSDGYSAQIDMATLKACADCMVAFTDTPGTFLAVMPGQGRGKTRFQIIPAERVASFAHPFLILCPKYTHVNLSPFAKHSFNYHPDWDHLGWMCASEWIQENPTGHFRCQQSDRSIHRCGKSFRGPTSRC